MYRKCAHIHLTKTRNCSLLLTTHWSLVLVYCVSGMLTEGHVINKHILLLPIIY